MATAEKNKTDVIQKLFSVGAHFGLIRSRRHPSAAPFIFGVKNRIEIFDLEKTSEALSRAKEFVKEQARAGGLVLFVGGKNEAQAAVREGALSTGMPYVAGRWLGGTLTNFSEIKKRVARLEDLLSQKEKGELAKYTKKERLLIDREIESLQISFSGLTPMKTLPRVLLAIDPRKESIAVREARKLNIPIVALASSDCDMNEIDYPIPGNDSSKASIEFFVNEIVDAVNGGKKLMLALKEE